MTPLPPTTVHSAKNWHQRALIRPRLIVLHSTESPPGSGAGVAQYLARPDVQADVQRVIDFDGRKWNLVPDNRKAWHVAGYNPIAIGIEQVGRAAQTHWPYAQRLAVAYQLSYWSYHKHIPLRDARLTFRLGAAGVVTHSSLGAAGGGHSDPGANYPFGEVLRLARHIKRRRYGSVRAYA